MLKNPFTEEITVSHIPTSTPFPDFLFSARGKTLRTQGTLHEVSEADALQHAASKNSIVVGIVPFDPRQSARLYVPDSYSWTPTQTPAAPLDLPEPTAIQGIDNPEFRAAVAESVALLNKGELEKVVLSRLLEISYASEVLDPQTVYHNLTVLQPKAYIFSAKLGEGNYLMGASPELVFKVENQKLSTHPLAGSATRIPGATPTDDAQIGEALLRSSKDRAEHAAVINDISARLRPLTEQLNIPAVPTLLTTPQLWHLGTPISGVLKEQLTSLDGARAIHPTPAICGVPREKALALIDRLEDFDRGFFGGLVGWMDAEGNGEWALVLRCARLEPHKATLFAGCGIVKDSQPASEHAETATKLASFAQALNITLES